MTEQEFWKLPEPKQLRLLAYDLYRQKRLTAYTEMLANSQVLDAATAYMLVEVAKL